MPDLQTRGEAILANKGWSIRVRLFVRDALAERGDLLFVAARAREFLRVFDGLAQDENDGTYALWTDADLHDAAHGLRDALTQATPSPPASASVSDSGSPS